MSSQDYYETDDPVPKLGHMDCGDASKTPLIATVTGGIIQPKPYCLTWKCQNIECRMQKAQMYLYGEDLSKLRWIGWVPEKNYNAARDVKRRRKAKTITISYNIGDRLIASDWDLTPRAKLMVKRANLTVIQRLAHEMVTGDVKAVSPAPPKQSRGGKLLGIGEAWPQYKVVQRAGYELKDGEVGDGFYDRKSDDRWTQEEVVVFVGGQLDTVKLIDPSRV